MTGSVTARRVGKLGLIISFVAFAALPAFASVRDAGLTGETCAACHTAGAKLSDIGRAYMAISNRLRPIGDRPVAALKSTGAYVSDGNGPGLPKAINDYLSLAFAGKLSPRLSYSAYQGIVDGGTTGIARCIRTICSSVKP